MRNVITSIVIALLLTACSAARHNPEPELPRKFVTIGIYDYELKSELGYALPVLYRQIVGQTSKHLVLNPNLGFGGWTPKAFGSFRISPDQKLIAFTVDLLGDGDARLFVETIGGAREPLPLKNVSSFEWLNQTSSLLVATAKDHRPQDVYLVALNKPAQQIFHESDPASYLKLLSGRGQIGLHADHPRNSRALFYNSSESRFDPIFKDCPHLLEFDLTSVKATAVCWNNPKTQLLQANLTDPSRSKLLYQPDRDRRALRDLQISFDRVAVTEHGEGPATLVVFEDQASAAKKFNAPDLFSELNLSPDKIDFLLHSFLAPGLKRASLEQARSIDGALIPLTILHGTEPTTAVVLRVYGSYGAEHLPRHDPTFDSLYPKGIAVAFCHVRGGGFYGPLWHYASVKDKKLLATEDYLACQKFLSSRGYKKIIAFAKSAGAVPVANAIIQEPDAFAGVILDAPFLAIESTLKDPTMPHNQREFFEWGNPHLPHELRAMKAFDPANISGSANYPPVFVTARRGDMLVRYQDAEQWVRKLKRLSTGTGPYLTYFTDGISHAGEENFYEDLATVIFRRQFILERIN